MFEKYLLVRHDFQNVSQNGQIIGFQVKIKIPYYRGVYLSQIEGVKLKLDDEEFTSDVMTFTVPEHGPNVPDSPLKTYTFKELATATTARWYFGDTATLTVKKPGGTKPGVYKVTLSLLARNSYLPHSDPQGLFDFGIGRRGAGGPGGPGVPGGGPGAPGGPGGPVRMGGMGTTVTQTMTLVM
jgi:hypothetical protein